jgi:hypothetical protein
MTFWKLLALFACLLTFISLNIRGLMIQSKMLAELTAADPEYRAPRAFDFDRGRVMRDHRRHFPKRRLNAKLRTVIYGSVALIIVWIVIIRFAPCVFGILPHDRTA